MIDENLLAKIIGSSVGTYPEEVLDMLIKNGIVLPSPDYTVDQLVTSVLQGLNKNEVFLNEYGMWLETIITTLNF